MYDHECSQCFFVVQTGAVKKLLKYTAETTGAVIQEEAITFPLTSNEQVWLDESVEGKVDN